MAKNVLELVYSAIDELNQQLPPAKRVAKSEATPLTGSSGALDSLGFLNLIVIVEDKVNAAHNSAIALASSMMESQRRRRARSASSRRWCRSNWTTPRMADGRSAAC